MADKINRNGRVGEICKRPHSTKIDNSELHLIGFNMENADDFKREFEIYRTALLEGIINGIFLCGCEINGIE